MKFLNRANLVGAKARRFVEYPVPWDAGSGIRLRSLTAREHGEFEAATLSKKGGLVTERLVEAKRRLIVLTLVDEQGNQILEDSDVAQMESTDARLVNWIYQRALDHLGVSENEVEDLAKNSGKITVDDSASGSPKS